MSTNIQLSRKSTGKKGKQMQFWFQSPLLKRQYDQLGIGFKLDSTSLKMTNLQTLAKSRTSTVVTVVIQEAIDTLGVAGPKGKKAQFLVYYSSEEGKDKYGKNLSSAYVSWGIDQLADLEERWDEDGEPLEPEIGRIREVFTIPFSKEALDKALEGQSDENRRKPIQYSIALIGGASYGGFTRDEMSLPFKELIARGKLGKAGSDNSVMFSDLSTKETLFLEKQASKQ